MVMKNNNSYFVKLFFDIVKPAFNFFTLNQFLVILYFKRYLVISFLIQIPSLTKLDCKVADALPPALSSGWRLDYRLSSIRA